MGKIPPGVTPCSNCVYYQPPETTEGTKPESDGECRRQTPSAHAIAHHTMARNALGIEVPHTHVQIVCGWPKVFEETGWCGQGVPKASARRG